MADGAHGVASSASVAGLSKHLLAAETEQDLCCIEEHWQSFRKSTGPAGTAQRLAIPLGTRQRSEHALTQALGRGKSARGRDLNCAVSSLRPRDTCPEKIGSRDAAPVKGRVALIAVRVGGAGRSCVVTSEMSPDEVADDPKLEDALQPCFFPAHSCPYLHRTTGDTERKYHLRYYKTGTCIHETDARGHCAKNGLHCAFAHGPHDLRPPVYDIREIQAQEALQNGQLGAGEGIPDLQPGVLASQAMIEKTLTEDPRWQDTNFVLANYKTDQCTKPPRLCRQGYACPHYHNSRDRRRNPRKFKYRSTPCPNVKHGDEWGEPSKCDSGDSCQYCHSRTEQQFHPEIYKSTKCNDMRQTGYCPRGPFCAFAHVEITSSSGSNSSLSPIGPISRPKSFTNGSLCSESTTSNVSSPTSNYPKAPGSLCHFLPQVSCSSSPTVTSSSGSNSSLSPIGPISRPKSFTNGSLCSESTTSNVSSPTSNYPKAPGFEREDQAKNLKSHPVDGNQKPVDQEKQEIKIWRLLCPDHQVRNLISVFSAVNPLASSITSSITSSLASSIGSDSSSPTTLSTMNAKATPFYPGSNTVESVIGSALDLNFGDINVTLDKELEEEENSDLGLTSQRLLGGSAPVNIPGSLARSSSLHSSSSLSASPLSSLSQSLSQSVLSSAMAPQQSQPQAQPAKAEHSLLGTSASSQNSLGLNGGAGSIWDFVSGSFSPSPSPGFSTIASATASSGADLARLRRELDDAKRKIKQWEDSWQQVKQACDAWQKEAQEAKDQAKAAEAERQLAFQKRDDAERRLKQLQEDFTAVCPSPSVPLLRSCGDIDQLPLPKLHSIQSQLRADLELIDGVIYQLQSKKCIPCQHYVLCENCAPSKTECPYCKTKILKW
ncbi:UNKL ligase, partial [Atractosteus spatula]|nr:UNKL ligase [Atractosteus spatula]